MLIKPSTKLEKDDLVTFKIVNGEEVIARLIADEADHYLIAKPRVLAMGPKGPAIMSPLMTGLLDDAKEVKLSKSHVIFVAQTDKDFEVNYIQSTTGLATVNTSIK